ncbi:ABC transporter ATP-binding protein [Halomarina halobia]|uniref:ABC transporter ATP-binding protein n=1 Tax=Halomarina halobia TaxID=3033386 RepID=A0ABD6ACY9_9EURY|nr:ABC transporter ATP-binding protein [Halomarina sp. PSR21]
MAGLTVDAIDTYYGQSQVLHDVSLNVDDGEVVALLGRNGAGKTTTLRSVAGIAPPRSGRIQYDGDDITKLSTFEIIRRGIGYVPEDRQVWEPLTVAENLEMPAGRGGEWTVKDAYDLFPTLSDLREAKAGDLSGGEQQMLVIARGLLGGTDLLLLDEPSEGLAPQIVADVRDALVDLKDDLTILIVEQNVKLALAIADRVYVLANGRIVYESVVDNLDADDPALREHIAV